MKLLFPWPLGAMGREWVRKGGPRKLWASVQLLLTLISKEPINTVFRASASASVSCGLASEEFQGLYLPRPLCKPTWSLDIPAPVSKRFRLPFRPIS